MDMITSLIDKGGPVMWPLLILCTMSLVISTERLLMLAMPWSWQKIRAKISHNNTLHPEERLQAIEHDLFRFFPLLSTIIAGAPMLGILGTVLGIIRAFEAIALEESDGIPLHLLADGIAQALITTAVGLSVALITLAPYNLLRAKATQMMARLETLLSLHQTPKTETTNS